MKKVLLTLLVALACSLTASAQDVFVKGDKVFHAGLGFGSYLGETGASSLTPPVLVSGEYGITDALLSNGKGYVGLGGYLAYSADEYKFSGYKYKCTNVIVGARGAFHYQFVDKLDTYAGVMLGYNAASIDDKNLDLSYGGFTHSSFVGARYYFTDKIGAFGEIGYGIAALELGVAIKF